MDRWMDVWLDGWMVRWIDARMYLFISV